jgi:hypothetical protein
MNGSYYRNIEVAKVPLPEPEEEEERDAFSLIPMLNPEAAAAE